MARRKMSSAGSFVALRREPISTWRVWGPLAAAALALAPPGAMTSRAEERASSAVRLPSYTRIQSVAGRDLYERNCAGCHGVTLQGGVGPPLAGAGFKTNWGEGRQTVADLVFIIRTTMPLSEPDTLSRAQYDDVTAYILSINGFPSGRVALGPMSASAVIGSAHGRSRLPPESFPTAPKFVQKAVTTVPGDSELVEANNSGWLMYNGTYDGSRYSPLKQISVANAKDLRVACRFRTGQSRTFEASPVIYNGIMYVTTANHTFALDAENCRKVWSRRYQGGDAAETLRLSQFLSVNRGVAIYRGKLYRATPNGHLIALDARTGRLLWDVWVADPARGYWLSAAPIAYDHYVFIGTAGADLGTQGFVYAFDAETGKVRWRFADIARDPHEGTGSHEGGATWSTYTLDYRHGLLLVPIGNPTPDFKREVRPGDDRYTNSVVALNYRTGKLAWYVQQVPRDVHDWDTAAAPVIYEEAGHSYMAVANKAGWVYIYDRADRRLIGRTSVTRHSNINLPISRTGVHVCPGVLGGVEWNGPAYSPWRGMLYVNSVQWCGTFRSTHEDRYVEGMPYYDGSVTLDPSSKASGWTTAIDAVTGKVVWSRKSTMPMIAALTPTAGGVVFTGSLDGDFLVLDARTGATLYRFDTGGAIGGAASTYLIGGRQYVSVTTGNRSAAWHSSGPATVLVFTLGQEDH